MPLGVSAAVHTFHSELRQAYEEVKRSELYAGYKDDEKLAICDCIKDLLNKKSWAAARNPKRVARGFAKFYADKTDVILDDLKGLSEFAQAELRIKMWKIADAALRDEVKDPARLRTALAGLGPMESTEGLSKEPNRKRAKLSDANDSAGARAEEEDARAARLAERGQNARTMKLKAARISPKNKPLMTDTFCHTAYSDKLWAGMDTVYASYLAIRKRITSKERTKNFQSFYQEFSAVVEQALDDRFWQPRKSPSLH
jgi:hypothetical protein